MMPSMSDIKVYKWKCFSKGRVMNNGILFLEFLSEEQALKGTECCNPLPGRHLPEISVTGLLKMEHLFKQPPETTDFMKLCIFVKICVS